MNGIGLDCGNTTVKLVLLSPTGELLWSKIAAHRGSAIPAARRLLGELLQWDSGVCGCPVVLTGSAGERLLEICPGLSNLGDIPAIHRGVILLAPEARSVIEIGSQSARFLTGFGSELPPQFAVNEHCAGGTGSFFEDQMSRLGLRIEDYSNLVAQAESIPRLSGRCAVFAKTDIIHRQQEGIPTPDILLGLCYAMVRNYKAVIVRSLPVERPVALCGGVAQNAGVVQAVKAVFGLEEEDLIKMLYACDNCHYLFPRTVEKTCPDCGKTTIRQQPTKNKRIIENGVMRIFGLMITVVVEFCQQSRFSDSLPMQFFCL